MVDLRRFDLEGLRMKSVLILILVMLSSPVLAQQAFSSLEEQMTGKEFSAAGLDKLTPEEMATLNNWIRSRSLATLESSSAPTTASAAVPADSRGFETKKMRNADRTPVTSRIVGKFTGWDGNTVFTLENGMVWEQDDKDTFHVREIDNPAVTIKPHAFNTWRLSVEGYGSECKVKRLQ